MDEETLLDIQLVPNVDRINTMPMSKADYFGQLKTPKYT